MQSQEIIKDSLVIEDLDEVIVTATRTERQLSSLPLPAQLVSKKEIKDVNSVRLSDILNEQTGLITVPDFGGGEGIQLQGLDSQYTLILIDGVPLIGRSAGTLDITRITVGNIKQIEIVKGASSSLYGSDALGGVVNIITEDPKEGFNTVASYRQATFNTNDANIHIGYKKNKGAFSAYVNRYSSEGYDLNEEDDLKTVDAFENYTFNSKFIYDISDKTSLLLSGRYFLQEQDYMASSDLTGESKLNEWNTRLKIEHKFSNKWNNYFEFYATNYKAEEYLNEPDGVRYSESSFDQLLIRPEARTTFSPNKKHSFIAGLGWNHETLNRDDFLENPKFNSQYVYIQYDGQLNDKLNLIAGTRFDNHSEYSSQVSPKIALRYELLDKVALKGSIGYGFKAPDFRQLYFDFTNSTVGYTVLGYNAVSTRIPQLEEEGVISNTVVPVSEFEEALNPESSLALNLGVQYKFSKTVWMEANFFRNDIKDLIDTRVIANRTNGQNVFSYYNVHRVYTQGIELNTNWKPTNQLKLRAGYQLLFAKDKEAKDAFSNGEVFARDSKTQQTFQLEEEDYFGLYNRSRHMANLKVFYDIIDWKLNTNARLTYRSKYGLMDSNSNGYLDNYDEFVNGYAILDWAINKNFLKNYQLGFGIDNLLDFADAANITNIPGRIFYTKLNIQLVLMR